jgi:hypothetical protein
LKNHPLFTAFKKFTGNARGCVLTEPLWGIPYNLYIPYVSVYMLTIGLKDSQIGLITSVAWGLQIIWALLGGVITDKLGRKRSTFYFDLIAWSIPTVIWAVAQNFWYFLIAAAINSVWRVTQNSWTCLMVEDTDPTELMDIYSWIYIAGLLAAFFAPIAGLLIGTFSLVPTMRGLYVLAFVMMTLKFILTYKWTTETQQGHVRMLETRDQKLFSVLHGYRGVVKTILRTPSTVYTGAIMLIMTICAMINSTFWSIIVTEKLQIPAGDLAIYPFAKSIIMLVFFFYVTPRIQNMHFRLPVMLGFLCFVLSEVILVSLPAKSYVLLLVSIFLEACAYATVNPQLDRMLVLNVDPKERARINSILYVAIITLTSPFGWIGGELSSLDRTLPFILNISLLAIGVVLAYLAGRSSKKQSAQAAANPES